MNDAKEDVRARLSIEDVIGEYIELKRAGRNFKGLSPFSGEKTPSFVVSPDKNIWHDFSSNKGGDVFSFIMEAEGVEFREALEILARKANVDLTMYDSGKGRALAHKKKLALEINELASNYYQHCLLQNKHAIDYVFKRRNLNKETVEAFKVGYAPNGRDYLVNFLIKKGYSKQDIKSAGLTNRYGGDLFRGRMMVPLMDTSGRVIGFTGRVIGGDANAPKYLNTPQTILYDKSWHVFALSQAKESIREKDYSVIVEGNLDAVSSWKAGVKNVVATAGTAMTIHHLKTISRLSSKIKLAFDSDKAGLAATERAISLASEAGVFLSIISLPEEYKDPDELIESSVKEWEKYINSAIPAVDWVLRQYAEQNDLTTARGKRIYTTESLKLIKTIDDPVEKEHYLNIVRDATSTSLESLNLKMKSESESKVMNKKSVQKSNLSKNDSSYNEIREDKVLAIGLYYPELRSEFSDAKPEYFSQDKRKEILHFIQNSDLPITENIPKELKKYEDYVKMETLVAENLDPVNEQSDRSKEIKDLLRRIKDENHKRRRKQLENMLRTSEYDDDDGAIESIMKEILHINKELNS